MQENLIKIKLTNRGADEETPWAEDLGAAESHGIHGPAGSRVVRLANVPYLHAKPTHGDVIVVSPNEAGELVWDRDGLPWTQIGSRIHHDGGRWAMIIDYMPTDDASGKDAYEAIRDAAEALGIIVEGAWGPKEGGPGRVYFAILRDRDDRAVMAELMSRSLPCSLAQIHPARPAQDVSAESPAVNLLPADKPAKGKKATKPAKAPPAKAKAAPAKAAKTAKVAAKTAKAAKNGAAKKPAAKKPAAKKPAVKAAAKKPAAKPAAKPAKKPGGKSARR